MQAPFEGWPKLSPHQWFPGVPALMPMTDERPLQFKPCMGGGKQFEESGELTKAMTKDSN